MQIESVDAVQNAHKLCKDGVDAVLVRLPAGHCETVAAINFPYPAKLRDDLIAVRQSIEIWLNKPAANLKRFVCVARRHGDFLPSSFGYAKYS